MSFSELTLPSISGLPKLSNLLNYMQYYFFAQFVWVILSLNSYKFIGVEELTTSLGMTNVEGTHIWEIVCRNQRWTGFHMLKYMYKEKKIHKPINSRFWVKGSVSCSLYGFSHGLYVTISSGKKSNSLLQGFPLTTTFDEHFFYCIFGFYVWLNF